jgi:DNA polymerase-3 subunit gamma/tau
MSSCSLDVIEIDGASNRGIDDIRQINESIGYAPTSGKYKVYIIDEVHMLTKEAFNALLKTLEEPPSTIKFFFATTEPHKVPPTILSRCQRFDLKRISNEKIIEKLQLIAKDIEREVEKEALQLIAHYSEGSMRDAESLFDQIVCYESGLITEDVIYQILGFMPKDAFFELDSAMNEGLLSFAFDFVDKIFQTGRDISYFMEELLEHFRYLLLIKLGQKTTRLAHLSKHILDNYLHSANWYSEEQCIYIVDFLLQMQPFFHKSFCKKITLEMMLLQIIRSKNRIPISSLVKRLVEMEKNFSTPSQKEKAVELEKVPFAMTEEKEETILKKPKVQETSSQKPKSHYDTLLRFASVELDGVLKEEN